MLTSKHPSIMKKFILITFTIAASVIAEPEKSSFEPTSQFQATVIEGFTIQVNKRLYEQRKEIGSKALRQMKAQLYVITRIVPEKQLAALRRVPIWLDDRKDGPAQYHPDQGWLIKNNYNPDKQRSVDISKPEHLLEEFFRQPYLLLHELAHAYHHRELSFDDPRIIKAYKVAKKSGTYENVLTWWQRDTRHYALTNHKEYFAETTEAYLGQNDFFPFVRAELKRHDPMGYKLMQEIWGK